MPIGETDTEVAFCLLMQALSSGAVAPVDEKPQRMLAAFASFARQMRELGPANIIRATDGVLLVQADRRTQRPGVIEPPGLWILHRSCRVDAAERLAGAGIDISHSTLNVVLVASVPLTQEHWQPLERGASLAIARGQVIRATIQQSEGVSVQPSQ